MVTTHPVFRSCPILCGLAFTFASILLPSHNSHAVEFAKGELYGSFDTTFTAGSSWRVQNQDRDIIAIAAPRKAGSAFSSNSDDGNLNYDRGDQFSQIYRVTSELDLDWRNFGAFVRATAFYDKVNNDDKLKKIQLSDDARKQIGSNAEILDAFVEARFVVAKRNGQVRVGEQVLSWGESTFIPNSINTINTVDVNQLRTPGSELKEALLPQGMVSGSIDLTENTALEAFYLYDFDVLHVDPSGSYFSSQDGVGNGATRFMLGFGGVPDNVPPSSGAVVQRAKDDRASDQGQFGFALRYYSEALGDTEFGAYFMNYHSRLPIISAISGTIDGVVSGSYVESARYFLEYPEDIQLYGVSFNTQLGTSGVALQGEISYRQDMPLQVDDNELLFAALGAQDSVSPGANPAASALASLNQIGRFGLSQKIPGFIERDVSQIQFTGTKVFGPTFGANTFAMVGEVGMMHVQSMPKKSKLRLEAPGTFISGNTELANTLVPAGSFLAPPPPPATPVPVVHQRTAPGLTEDRKNFPDATSWGYRILGRLVYNNAIGAMNLSPRISFQHDVNGISPGPGGPFLEGRKAISLGLEGTYQNTWSVDFTYTNFFGAGDHNLINDRDFVSITLKYSI